MSAIPLFAETPVDVIRNELEQTLQLQRDAYLAQPYPDLAQRKADLRKLQAFLRDHREAILDAISADYGNRSRHETLFAEFYGVIDGVDHAISHLKKWMKPQRRSVDLKNFFGASNRVIPQPVGVVGHIVPWNFPIFLCFGGLTSAFAAGNRCMVKMSENSRRLAQLLIDKAPAYFPKDKLAFFDETGGVGIEFSKLKFDHILFTGSGLTGRAVMAAASTNLCPVTLELGGKAPALVCDDFPLQKATERITFFKYFNAGQICTTADHVFVPQHKVSEFVEIARRTVSARYPSLDSPDFTSVIDELKRLEHEGYHFEAADGSLELLMRRASGWVQPFFELESYRVIVAEGEDLRHDTEAIVKLKVNGERIGRIGEGNGPVNALDDAVRAAIGAGYPQLAKIHLTDFKVRVLDTAKGTGAVTRVLIDSTNGRRSWSTIGVSENIIQASWQALEDSIVFGLLHTEE